MRTTLDIEDDVLLAARDVARRDKTSIGAALSAMARQGLRAASASDARAGAHSTAERLARLGIRCLPHRGGIVTSEIVNRIRDEEGI